MDSNSSLLALLERERQALHRMIVLARKRGVPVAGNDVILAQSRKVDGLISTLPIANGSSEELPTAEKPPAE